MCEYSCEGCRSQRVRCSSSQISVSVVSAGRLKMLQEIKGHAQSNICILDRDRFSRVVTDAAPAAHEQHSDRTQGSHCEPVMTSTARQPQNLDPGPGN